MKTCRIPYENACRTRVRKLCIMLVSAYLRHFHKDFHFMHKMMGRDRGTSYIFNSKQNKNGNIISYTWLHFLCTHEWSWKSHLIHLKAFVFTSKIKFKGTNGRQKTYEIFHVYCIFYPGFMCQTTVCFGITKDGSLVLNTLASWNFSLAETSFKMSLTICQNV